VEEEEEYCLIKYVLILTLFLNFFLAFKWLPFKLVMTPEIYLYLYPHLNLSPAQQVRIIISLKPYLYLQQQASS